MYYNKIIGSWVLDPVDYLLLSASITSILAPRLKDYLSEKAAMARLKNAIIEESPLIKPSPLKPINFYSKKSKIKRIYKFALNNRGGQVDIEYQSAEKIKNVIIKLAVFFKKKELKARVLKIIFTQGRLLLQLILYTCKIKLQYLVVDEVNTQIIVITCCAGGTAGFVFSWFAA
jgi:hypothetical protein